jgi:hypothetical protein
MIFNSLGSNYTFKFALNALVAVGNDGDNEELKAYLEKRYQGNAILLYKGREAIKLALKLLNMPRNSRVGITGLTCYAVYQAVKEVGLKPVYLNINESLNFSADKVGDLKVLIVQNTLGNPCDVQSIHKICKEKNIVLIEDLAHSIGTIYKNGKEAGMVGDFTALSFSQDKAVDAISGGALIIRNRRYLDSNLGQLKNVSLATRLKDRFYPVLTFKIRNLYPYGLGKPFHFLLKNLNLLPRPVETDKSIVFHAMSNWHAKLAISSFKEFDSLLKHRREIASVYVSNLDEKIQSRDYVDNINLSSCLRFPIFIEKRQGLVNYLKEMGIFVSDVWYDAPIAPEKLLLKTDYNGECPFSEKVSKNILNLPTHINISREGAEFISKEINKWLNTK